jgi:hypothetical protein
MRNRCGPMFEALEVRQLMASTTPYLTNQCLPPPPTPPIPVFHSPLPAPPPAVSQPPLPPIPPVEAPGPTPLPPVQPPSAKPPKGRPRTTPDVTNPAVMVGQWTGSHQQDARQNPGSLVFQVMSNSKGQLYGKLKVTGPVELEFTAGIHYNRKTQRFTYFVLTPRMAVRFEGRLSIFSASTMDLQGTLQVITKKGAYRSTFSAIKPYTP